MNRLPAAISIILLVIGCGDGLRRDVPSMSMQTELRFDASIDDGNPLQTKGSISGTTFKSGNLMGLFVTFHDSVQTPPAEYVPYQIGYNNIKATSTGTAGTGWSFNNTVIGTTYPSFYITSRNDLATADIFAYYPYQTGVNRPDSIPFRQSDNFDLMWAAENGSATVNKDIQPDGITKNVPLHFQHALCRLRFNFRTENTGSNHRMDSIIIKKAGDLSTSLYKSGLFDATNGTFSNMVEVGTDSLCVVSNTNNYTDSTFIKYGYTLTNEYFTNKTTYTPFDILLYETEVQTGGDILVVFVIDGFRHTHTITQAEVEHRDAGGNALTPPVYGFKRGYTYTFNIILDNYVHLQNIEIKSEWTPETINVTI